MAETKTLREDRDSNLFRFVRFRYFPYWPLFAIILFICSGLAILYLKLTPPLYEATADLLIKDEKKGSDNTRMLESLNIFTTKKIVEDEIEVLQSQTLMKEVVRNLRLYAPVSEDDPITSISAYATSPVTIEAAGFDTLYSAHEKVFSEKIYFNYDKTGKKVILGEKKYPLDLWVSTDFGLLRFSPNQRLRQMAQKPLYFILFNPKLTTTNLINGLKVAAVSKLSSVVTLTLRDEVPQRGEDILNELIRVYNNAAINDKNQLAVNTISFIEDRLQHVKNELSAVEMQIQTYKTKNGGANLSEQSSAFLKSVSDNDQKSADMNMQLAVLNEVEKYVASKDNSTAIVPSTLGVNDPGLSQLLQKLYDSQINYEKLRRTVGENNPVVSSLSNEIEKIRPSILENIQIQKISLKAGLDNLNTTNGSYASRLQSVPQKEKALMESTRQEAILNSVYSFLLQKREENALSYASNVPDSRTINVAGSSIDPVSPKRSIAFGIALVLSMGLGVLIISGKEFLSSKILFRREIEFYTAIPVVAEIPNIKKNNNPLPLAGAGNIALHEQFRHLRTALGLHLKVNKKKKLLITSGISGEGKSFISANMALSLALSGRKVILLDLDFRNPKNSHTFKAEQETGISDYLEGDREPYEIIKKTTYDNLYIAAAGVTAANPSELTFNRKMSGLFDYLEGVFDFIIVDSPPIDPVSDAYILTEYCDATLYVVRHGYTPKGIIQLLDENIKIKPLKNPVIVFNGLKSRGFIKGNYGFDFGYGNEYVYKITRKSEVAHRGIAGMKS